MLFKSVAQTGLWWMLFSVIMFRHGAGRLLPLCRAFVCLCARLYTLRDACRSTVHIHTFSEGSLPWATRLQVLYFLFTVSEVSCFWCISTGWSCDCTLDKACVKNKTLLFQCHQKSHLLFLILCMHSFFPLVFCNLFNFSLSLLCFRFEELVKKFKVEYHAGGATQNSVKVAQVGAQSCSQY